MGGAQREGQRDRDRKRRGEGGRRDGERERWTVLRPPRAEPRQTDMPDLIWPFPNVDHFRPDRSSSSIQPHLTNSQPANQANQAKPTRRPADNPSTGRLGSDSEAMGKQTATAWATNQRGKTTSAAPENTHETSAMDALVCWPRLFLSR